MEYSEKPITIIYDDIHQIAPEAIADDGSAAIRMVKDEFCRQLIYKFNKPIISTSANISGQPALWFLVKSVRKLSAEWIML